jgi:hypothetical protein
MSQVSMLLEALAGGFTYCLKYQMVKANAAPTPTPIQNPISKSLFTNFLKITEQLVEYKT